MSNQKKGLIVFTIGWFVEVASAIMKAIDATKGASTFVGLAALIVQIVGLAIACKENSGLKKSLITIISQFVLTIIVVVLLVIQNIIYDQQGKTAAWEALDVAGAVVYIIANVLDILVVWFIVDGCLEASEKVKGMANVIKWFICIAVFVGAACNVVSLIPAVPTAVAGILAIVSLVASLLYELLICVILIRTIPKMK